jgi:hypothetical protein
MNGLQCSRLLWFANKKQLPDINLSKQHMFNQGHDFEEYVKKLFPEGVDLNGLGFMDNINKTTLAVEEGKTIFEAGFAIGGLFIRADIIKPFEDGWDLYEIKSTTQSKDVHVQDLAYQKYVLELSGLKVNNCFVIYLNREYVKDGEIDPAELTIVDDVTERVGEVDGIEEHVVKFKKVMSMSEYTDIPIGQRCNQPYECPLKALCWSTLPENNVLQLTNWRIYWKLFGEGVIDIKDIPSDVKLALKDDRLIESLDVGVFVSKEKVTEFLDSLNYPLYHFDFETFDTAVPLFDKSRPYQKMPFQYSVHVEQEDGTVEHREFLSEGGDPRLEILSRMKVDLEGTGDIIVYNKSFEISVMNKLAEDFPEHAEWLVSCVGRIVDLADVFRSFDYYNKSQKGSYSLKKVLPAVTGKDYSALEINNGGDASALYFYSHIKNDFDREKVRSDLLLYCGLDTEGMIWILDGLKRLINGG